MSNALSDLIYYKLRTVQIVTEDQSEALPKGNRIRSSLPNFGETLHYRLLRVEDGEIVKGKPNTAIVVFALQNSVSKILQSSRRNKSGSLWQSNSITARTLDKKGPVAELFSTQIVPKLSSQSESNGQSSGYKRHRQDSGRPAKRRKTESCESSSSDTQASSSPESTPESSPAASPEPESVGWMSARISELEAFRDAALSENSRVLLAYQVTISQKSAVEAELYRVRAEKTQLRIELEQALSQKAALSNDVDTLRGQLAAAEENISLVPPYSDESNERVKALQQELEESQDLAFKLQIRNSRLEEQSTRANTTDLDEAKAKAKQLEYEVKQLKFDLASACEQLSFAEGSLASTQRSLGIVEGKYSSVLGQHENTKAELGMYKSRLENEQATVQRLKDILTPELYRSVGVTYETLGAFLSITGLPPVGEEGAARSKNESD